MSMASSFDTLQVANDLTANGFSDEQARALVGVLRTSHERDDLVTKADLELALGRLGTDLRSDIADARFRHGGEIKDAKVDLLKWMFGQTVALLVAGAALIHYMK